MVYVPYWNSSSFSCLAWVVSWMKIHPPSPDQWRARSNRTLAHQKDSRLQLTSTFSLLFLYPVDLGALGRRHDVILPSLIRHSVSSLRFPLQALLHLQSLHPLDLLCSSFSQISSYKHGTKGSSRIIVRSSLFLSPCVPSGSPYPPRSA